MFLIKLSAVLAWGFIAWCVLDAGLHLIAYAAMM